MTFVYDNKKTGTFAEFDMNVDPNLSDVEKINYVIDVISKFDDSLGITLPKELLVLLTDEELDFFLLVAYNEQYKNTIEQMIYLLKYDSSVVDNNGVEYKVEYVGKYKTVLSLESLTTLSLFNVDNSDIVDGKYLQRCNKQES